MNPCAPPPFKTRRDVELPAYAASVAGSTGSTIDGSSFSGLLTRVEMGHMVIGSARRPHQVTRVRLLSQPTGVIGRCANDGLRLWMSATSSLNSVVMMSANVRIHSPEVCSFQLSQIPARPNGAPSVRSIAYGCFALCPVRAFHSKKPSTGTMQRRLRLRVAEAGQVSDRLALSVDWLAAAGRVTAPLRDESQRNGSIARHGSSAPRSMISFNLSEFS